MPTYLVAFVVSNFASLSTSPLPETNFTQHLYVRPNALMSGALGLETGRRIIEAMADRLRVGYTLPKMDQIAVPGFRGAMENWGLIIYGEPYLLWSQTEHTHVDRENVAVTVVHEYAHQWFGNLVTCKWWTWNWLNEGFATLYENHGVDWLFPEWRRLDTAQFSQYQSVMVHDSTERTRPMSRYVESPADVSGNFDSIGYAKCKFTLFTSISTIIICF